MALPLLPLLLVVAIADDVWARVRGGAAPTKAAHGVRSNRLALELIGIYQQRFPGIFACRFTPSCSVYGAECFTRYPFWTASWKTLGRVSRCNPWNYGCVVNDP